MHTHKHTPHTHTAQRDTVAGVWPRQKRSRSSTNSAPLETTVARGFHCVLRFSTRNTASRPKKRGFTPSPSLALLLSIVLGSVVKIESRQATNWTRSKRYGSFSELSAAPVLCPRQRCNNADVGMRQSGTFKATTNGDLCRFLRSFCSFLPLAINGRQYKCFGTQYFACTLQYNKYSYTTTASTLYIYIFP